MSEYEANSLQEADSPAPRPEPAEGCINGDCRPDSENAPASDPASGAPVSGKYCIFFRRLIGLYVSFTARFIRKNLPSVMFMTAVFFSGAFSGYYAGASDSSLIEILTAALNDKIDPGIMDDPLRLMGSLFLNNALVALTEVVFGLFVIVPLLVCFVNGFAVGVVSEAVIPVYGLPYLLAGLLPHGLPEIFAFLLAGGSGIRAGFYPVWSFPRGTFSGTAWLGEIKETAAGFLFVVLPILAAAAVIEAFVTPIIMDLFI